MYPAFTPGKEWFIKRWMSSSKNTCCLRERALALPQIVAPFGKVVVLYEMSKIRSRLEATMISLAWNTRFVPHLIARTMQRIIVCDSGISNACPSPPLGLGIWLILCRKSRCPANSRAQCPAIHAAAVPNCGEKLQCAQINHDPAGCVVAQPPTSSSGSRSSRLFGSSTWELGLC